jgi:profilin
VVKANTCVVFGTHDETIQGGNCNTCVGNLADYLFNNGM